MWRRCTATSRASGCRRSPSWRSPVRAIGRTGAMTWTRGSEGRMVAATSPSEPLFIQRFDRAERALHWANAALFGVLLATAAILYVGPLSAAVGRRELIRTIHVYSGL